MPTTPTTDTYFDCFRECTIEQFNTPSYYIICIEACQFYNFNVIPT